MKINFLHFLHKPQIKILSQWSKQTNTKFPRKDNPIFGQTDEETRPILTII